MSDYDLILPNPSASQNLSSAYGATSYKAVYSPTSVGKAASTLGKASRIGLGAVTVYLYASDIVEDYKRFEGKNLWLALGADTAALGIGVAVAALTASMAAGPALLIGVGVAVGTSLAVNYLKNNVLEEKASYKESY